MFSELSPIEWITVISFSLSLATIIAELSIKKKKTHVKSRLLVAFIIFAILAGTLATINALHKASNVDAMAEKIYVALGNQEKTIDQLLIELGPLDDQYFSSALAQLKSKNRIDSQVEKASLDNDRKVFVRLWRALPE